ncbi:MAG: SpoIID/LytB domain-containing protein [Alkaliphilus sp.]
MIDGKMDFIKKIRFFSIIFLAVIMSLVNIKPVLGVDKSMIPEYINIGLFFSSEEKAIVRLEANLGFNVNKLIDGQEVNLFSIFEDTEIFLRRDAHFIGKDGTFSEFYGNPEEDLKILALQGPYHVQIGSAFSSWVDAYEFLNTINLTEDIPFLAYENEWRVYTGLYVTEGKASEKANEISAALGVSASVIFPSTKRVQVMNKHGDPIFMFDSSLQIHFKPIEDKGEIALIQVNGRRYRGSITVNRQDGSDMTVINKVRLEEYLYGVVPREMPAVWPIEALKAQAVAARGFAVASMNKFGFLGFNLCSTVNSQVYGGFDAETEMTNRAVNETKSLLMFHNGQVITPFYHSNSGGRTEDTENIWSARLPFIRGVDDPFSKNVKHSEWSKSLTVPEIESILRDRNVNIGEIIDITVTEVSRNGRVQTLVISGTKGEEIMIKQTSRFAFGLRSSWFSVRNSDSVEKQVKNSLNSEPKPISLVGKTVISATGTSTITNKTDLSVFNGVEHSSIDLTPRAYVFDGRGFGHGLGMSQHGANIMAQQGFTFREILKHYYTDIEVK